MLFFQRRTARNVGIALANSEKFNFAVMSRIGRLCMPWTTSVLKPVHAGNVTELLFSVAGCHRLSVFFEKVAVAVTICMIIGRQCHLCSKTGRGATL